MRYHAARGDALAWSRAATTCHRRKGWRGQRHGVAGNAFTIAGVVATIQNHGARRNGASGGHALGFAYRAGAEDFGIGDFETGYPNLVV